MTMKTKLSLALVVSVLSIGTTTAVSAGPGGPPDPSDETESVFEWYLENPNPHIEEPHKFRELDNGQVAVPVVLEAPYPIFPTTSDHCRWTGFNGGETDGDLDSAYWLYYREYWNQASEGTEFEGLGDTLYGKQGSCMSNKGFDPSTLLP